MKPENALAPVELTEQMDHFPSQMSVGAKQRGGIARAIAKQLDVLFSFTWTLTKLLFSVAILVFSIGPWK